MIRLLTGLHLPEESSLNSKAIGQGERAKVFIEEPWLEPWNYTLEQQARWPQKKEEPR